MSRSKSLGSYNGTLFKIVDHHDARSFLRMALQIRFAKNNKVNYAAFSKAALGLPKDYAKLFYYLFQKDLNEAGSSSEFASVADIEEALQNARESIIKWEKGSRRVSKVKMLFEKRQALRVYASLNSEKTGASIFEIIHKTQLDLKVVDVCLRSLIEQDLVQFHEGRFYAQNDKLDFFNFKGQELANLTRDIASEISRNASQLVTSDDSFVFYSSFSVDSNNLSQMKNDLRTAIYAIIDKYQLDDGDRTEELFLCLKK